MSLAETIDALCLKHLGRRPNLDDPRGYNDKIQWLKLYDQRPEQIPACDKLAARSMVAEIAGDSVLLPSATWPPEWFPCVAKASHDSGSARLIKDASQVPAADEFLRGRLSRPYGVEKGEWAYALVEPRIVVERAMPGPVVDYKFHCVHGRIAWVQVIWNRASGKASEAILGPLGDVLPLHMDEKMRHAPTSTIVPGVRAWSALSDLAEALAEPWRYVRVDLYWSDKRPWFGELTFWPRAGCYRSDDEPVFGEMMNIDTTERLAPIVE